MQQIRDFKDLIAWQKAMSVTLKIYKVTKKFPKDEQFGIISQSRRAAVSVCVNIAEGYNRITTGEYVQFLGIAKGSLSELETIVLLSFELSYLNEQDFLELESEIQEIGKVLNGLIRSLKK